MVFVIILPVRRNQTNSRHSNLDKIIPLFVFIFLLSENEKNFTYRAASNDFAKVILDLKESHELNLTCEPLDDNVKFNFKGSWHLIDGYYELTFIKNKSGEPDLHSLFEDSRGRVIIVNNSRVKFRETESRIRIWGITCVKE